MFCLQAGALPLHCLPAHLPSSRRPEAPNSLPGAQPCPAPQAPVPAFTASQPTPLTPGATQRLMRSPVLYVLLGEAPRSLPSLCRNWGRDHAPYEWRETRACTRAHTHEGPFLPGGPASLIPSSRKAPLPSRPMCWQRPRLPARGRRKGWAQDEGGGGQQGGREAGRGQAARLQDGEGKGPRGVGGREPGKECGQARVRERVLSAASGYQLTDKYLIRTFTNLHLPRAPSSPPRPRLQERGAPLPSASLPPHP